MHRNHRHVGVTSRAGERTRTNIYSTKKAIGYVRREFAKLAPDADPSSFEDPYNGLMREVQSSAFTVEALAKMLYGDEADLLMFQDGAAPVIHPVYVMWCQERDRHAKLCKLAIDAGIAERYVRTAETSARLLGRLVVSVFEDPLLNLSGPQQLSARRVLATRLRQYAIGALDESTLPMLPAAVNMGIYDDQLALPSPSSP